MWIRTKIYSNLLIVIISVLWLVFAISGILTNHSYWTDESNVALYARQITETGKPDLPDTGYNTGWYQSGYQYLLAVFISIFGLTEFSTRLPSVIAGLGVIILTYLTVRTLTFSTVFALLAVMAQGWWAINLAYSTQTRPYMLLQLILISTIFILSVKMVWQWRLGILFGLILVASLLHPTGLFLGIVFSIYLIELISHKVKFFNQWKWLLFGLANIIFGLGLIFGLRYLGLTGEFNNWLYLKYLIRNHIWFLMIPFSFGIWYLTKKNQFIGVSVFSYTFWVFVVWLYFSYSYNIRYLIPWVGLLVVISFVGLAELFKYKKIWIGIRLGLVVLVLGVMSSQLIWWPKNYYSPNVWLYGDVQNADYKSAYKWMEINYGRELIGLAIFDSWNDRTLWYLKRPPEAMFVVPTLIPEGQKYDVTSGAYFYTTLEQFKSQQLLYPQGLVVVEEWQSTMPEDIKQYIRQNLKLEYTVKGLTDDEIDRWPLAIYSWGIN